MAHFFGDDRSIALGRIIHCPAAADPERLLLCPAELAIAVVPRLSSLALSPRSPEVGDDGGEPNSCVNPINYFKAK